VDLGAQPGQYAGSNEAQTAQKPLQLRAGSGNNAFDVRHCFNATTLYECPTPAETAILAVGWARVLNARTGLPSPDAAPQRHRLCGNSTAPWWPANRFGGLISPPPWSSPVCGSLPQQPAAQLVAGVNPYLSGSTDKRCSDTRRHSPSRRRPFGNLGRWALHGPARRSRLTLHKKFA